MQLHFDSITTSNAQCGEAVLLSAATPPLEPRYITQYSQSP